MAKKDGCLFENLMLGKLLNLFTDLPRVAYKMVAYKKKYVYLLWTYSISSSSTRFFSVEQSPICSESL